MDASQGREELERCGIPFSEEQFLRQVRSGNEEVVDLFLVAGVSPNASLDGESALSIATRSGKKTIARSLLRAGADPLRLVDDFGKSGSKKDGWEKLSSLSGVFTFMSSLLIAAVGWYFTNSYNRSQLDWTQVQAARDQENREYQNRLSELQAVEKMIPHLAKDESSKRSALLAISVLASPKLAAQFAEMHGGQGSLDALKQIATSSTQSANAPAVSALTSLASRETTKDAGPARNALASALQGKERAVVQLIMHNARVCNGFVVDGQRGWIVSSGYCLAGLGSGETKLNVAVQFWDGTRAKILETSSSGPGLFVFLRVDGERLSELTLATKSMQVGDTVTQLAFDLSQTTDVGRLQVNLGHIEEIGPMSFAGAPPVSAVGLKVALPEAAERTAQGTAGAPLLDGEGNVACMTFQADSRRREQCVAAEEIAAALKTIHKS